MTKHARIKNALILAPDCAGTMQNVELEIISRYVFALPGTSGILLLIAMLQLVSRPLVILDLSACFSFLATQRPIPVIQPCNPSPCGINAECTERNRAASCKCIRDYIGNPYVECKPECITNNECPRDKACVNQHCVDPCPGVCGAHATCQANNHRALCRCDPGYTGDAFVSCQRITTRKSPYS